MRVCICSTCARVYVSVCECICKHTYVCRRIVRVCVLYVHVYTCIRVYGACV